MNLVSENINESIKHLKPRSEEEIRSSLKNLSSEEKLKTGAEEGLLWLVKDALNKGADVHAYNDYALRLASDKGHVEVVKMLLDAGANVHADNDGALRLASWSGHVEVVKVLLDAGAYGHLEVVKLLKQYSKKKKRVNESIKHLKSRSEEELYNIWKKRIEEINQMNPYDMITTVYEEVRDYEIIPRDKFGNIIRNPISWKRIASELLGEISSEERKKAIMSIINNYFFG